MYTDNPLVTAERPSKAAKEQPYLRGKFQSRSLLRLAPLSHNIQSSESPLHLNWYSASSTNDNVTLVMAIKKNLDKSPHFNTLQYH